MSEAGRFPPASPPGPSGPAVNQGMQVSGGTFLGPVAGGAGARLTVNQGSAAEDPVAQLERLLQALEAGAASLPAGSAEDVADDVGRLREEAHHPRPDSGRITQLLTRLATQVAPVGALLEIVNQVKDLVVALPH